MGKKVYVTHEQVVDLLLDEYVDGLSNMDTNERRALYYGGIKGVADMTDAELIQEYKTYVFLGEEQDTEVVFTDGIPDEHLATADADAKLEKDLHNVEIYAQALLDTVASYRDGSKEWSRNDLLEEIKDTVEKLEDLAYWM